MGIYCVERFSYTKSRCLCKKNLECDAPNCSNLICHKLFWNFLRTFFLTNNLIHPNLIVPNSYSSFNVFGPHSILGDFQSNK